MPTTLKLTQDPAADALLSSDPLALLIGMLLDQQFPMERAFAGPYLLKERLGRDLDAAEIAAHDPDALTAVFTGPPAIHRYPGSMAKRVQEMCAVIRDEHAGDAGQLWLTAASGQELLARLKKLPGYGEQKAKIFVALLGKQLGVRPPGWEEAAGAYSEQGSRRSIADVTNLESLLEVRAFKQAQKKAAKA